MDVKQPRRVRNTYGWGHVRLKKREIFACLFVFWEEGVVPCLFGLVWYGCLYMYVCLLACWLVGWLAGWLYGYILACRPSAKNFDYKMVQSTEETAVQMILRTEETRGQMTKNDGNIRTAMERTL